MLTLVFSIYGTIYVIYKEKNVKTGNTLTKIKQKY